MISRLLAGLVGVVILFAGATKLTGFTQWKSDARTQGLWPAVAYALPVIELTIGALLIVLTPTPLVLGLASLLVLIFTVYLVVLVASGSTVPCACFGAKFSRPPSGRDILRNCAMLIALFVSAALI
ncbi:MAG: MauE/DoxX family redox-associated membrane protein [Ilumatobacteraceae bacterium]